MCLQITVTAERITGERASEIADAFNDNDKLLKVNIPEKKWFEAFEPGFLISEDGSCSCSLLTEEADWNAEVWDMGLELLPKLAKTVEKLYGEINAPFNLQALWAGEKATAEIDVSLTKMLEVIRKNQLGTKIKYKIGT
jgi:hypothetical protein